MTDLERWPDQKYYKVPVWVTRGIGNTQVKNINIIDIRNIDNRNKNYSRTKKKKFYVNNKIF